MRVQWCDKHALCVRTVGLAVDLEGVQGSRDGGTLRMNLTPTPAREQANRAYTSSS
jgi:hypothetical protein